MQGIFQKENTDKALKYGIYRHLPTYEKIIRNLVSFFVTLIHNSNSYLYTSIPVYIYLALMLLFFLIQLLCLDIF